MNLIPAGYLAATRHPWSCVLFVFPLLVAYELGVTLLQPAQPEALRNGADIWLRWTLGQVGLSPHYWPPLLLASPLLLWAWLRRKDRPQELPGVWACMVVESVAFALGLWGISRGLRPLLDTFGTPLQLPTQPEPAVEQMICFLGAGIYEETLFRLVLASALYRLFTHGKTPLPAAGLLAAGGSALMFAAAHNIGPHGEAFEAPVFVFRTLAGLYFSALFQLRGFGVAVGAHAGYDVLVGVIVPCV